MPSWISQHAVLVGTLLPTGGLFSMGCAKSDFSVGAPPNAIKSRRSGAAIGLFTRNIDRGDVFHVIRGFFSIDSAFATGVVE